MNPYTVAPYLREREFVFVPAEAPEDLIWRDAALCAQTDPDEFFPEKGESSSRAKAVCRACTVRADCLRFALDRGEEHGVWGGLTPEERRAADDASLADIIAGDDAVFYARQDAAAEKTRARDRKYAAANRARVAAARSVPQFEGVAV